ncbi:MAG: methyltransferase [Gammaproteobacteria bacterium]|nr:methyltransferase [Gammaproteobacteria bacterium]
MELLVVPQGEFKLSRYPKRKNELLRAWDAADEYLLNYLDQLNFDRQGLNVLIVNDGFGALTTALSTHIITHWTDSWLSQQGVKQNLPDNNLNNSTVTFKNSIETPQDDYDLVLIKLPKSHAHLEDQLVRIKPFLLDTTTVIAAAMVKSIHTSTLKLFEKYIGTTKTSLAKKKARLIFAKVDKNIPEIKSPYPRSYLLEGTDYKIINHANVFSRESLDIGTRLFIQHLPKSECYKKIIDLGCGNGIVGLIAAEKNPDAEIIFTDESYMAIQSAQENFVNAFTAQRKAQFIVNDCLTGFENESVDLVLNNPPFHQNNAVGDAVAWKMFKQSKKILKNSGELWVIGNRHLGYHITLKKIFSNCEMIASNKKFVILKSIKN